MNGTNEQKIFHSELQLTIPWLSIFLWSCLAIYIERNYFSIEDDGLWHRIRNEISMGYGKELTPWLWIMVLF